MRLAQLSERSGITTATVKYYLREGLLPPGRRVSATQSEYDESHLRRLRLISALTQVGGLPMTTAREVLAVVDDDSQDQHSRIGAAVWALPHGTDPAPDDPAVSGAERTAQ
ncbi:MAG TPA: MerR family transcriptional regulator, partial [Streptomyces sp.]|nr:MerR family transcriptional regulator [Streptomyces sp.]